MKLHTERQGDVAIVEPEGPLDGGELTTQLETAMYKLIYDGQEKIVLDLGKTSRVSSMGLGTLIGIQKQASAANVTLHLCNIDKRITDMLTVVKLLRFFKVFETRKQAIAAFAVVVSLV